MQQQTGVQNHEGTIPVRTLDVFSPCLALGMFVLATSGMEIFKLIFHLVRRGCHIENGSQWTCNRCCHCLVIIRWAHRPWALLNFLSNYWWFPTRQLKLIFWRLHIKSASLEIEKSGQTDLVYSLHSAMRLPSSRSMVSSCLFPPFSITTICG